MFEELYDSVKTGNEAKITIEANSKDDYRQKLNEELSEIGNSEIWETGETVRGLEPENFNIKDCRWAEHAKPKLNDFTMK